MSQPPFVKFAAAQELRKLVGDEATLAAARAANPTAHEGAKAPPLAATGMSPTDPRPADGNQYPAGVGPLGVDLALLARLPQDLRRRVIDGLEALDAAMRQGNKAAEDTAAAALAALVGEIQSLNAEIDARKFFAGALAKPQGTRDVMQAFAKRAGVNS